MPPTTKPAVKPEIKLPVKRSKKIFLVPLIVLVLLLGGTYLWQYKNELEWKNISAGTLTFPKTSIAVEVVNTPELRKVGLGGRSSIDDKSGMLFVFDTFTFPEFWMKDMMFTIDIIFFDRNFNVVDIKENFSPETYPETYKSKQKAKYAVEVKSGFSKQFEIKVGSWAQFEAY